MLMAFVGREQSVPSPSSRTCNSTGESSFIFSNSGTAKVALCLVCRITGNLPPFSGNGVYPVAALAASPASRRYPPLTAIFFPIKRVAQGAKRSSATKTLPWRSKSSRRAVRVSLAPAWASWRASSSPMPDEAPVMSTTLSRKKVCVEGIALSSRAERGICFFLSHRVLPRNRRLARFLGELRLESYTLLNRGARRRAAPFM